MLYYPWPDAHHTAGKIRLIFTIFLQEGTLHEENHRIPNIFWPYTVRLNRLWKSNALTFSLLYPPPRVGHQSAKQYAS